MPSRLSSLLVRDGLVGVKRMEKAFQRQVIYGGSLDTILLEMNLIPEDRLVQYLALASGLPPAARDEGDAIDPEAVALISRDLAEQYRAVPVGVESDAVRILVCSPLEISELEDLADLLDRALQPLIVPEYRWNLVYSAAYGLDPPARFTQLARTLDGDPSTPAVGRAPSVIIADAHADAHAGVAAHAHAPGHAPGPAPASAFARALAYTPAPAAVDYAADAARANAVADAAYDDIDAAYEIEEAQDEAQAEAHEAAYEAADEAAHEAEAAGAAPNPVSDETAAAVEAAQLPPVVPDSSTLRLPGAGRRPADDTIRRPGAEQDVVPPRRRQTMVGVVPHSARPDVLPFVRITAPVPVTAPPKPPPRRSGSIPVPSERPTPGRVFLRPSSSPIATAGRDDALTIVEARELLAEAEDRDTVFLTLLRAARARARWAGLLTIQGGAAVGRLALAEPGLDAKAISTVLIPLDVVSPFRQAVASRQPHVGSLASTDPSISTMVLRLGSTTPTTALILPIVLRQRVVAIVVAHRGSIETKLSDVTELLPLATAASDAIGRLIVMQKSAHQRALEEESEITRRVRQTAPAPDDLPDDAPAEPPSQPSSQSSSSALPLPAPAESSPRLPAMTPTAAIAATVTAAISSTRLRAASAAPATTASSPAITPPPPAEPPKPIADLLWAIESGLEGSAQVEAALAEALARAPETLAALAERFPGKLRVERFAVTGRALRAAQYGGLLELVVRLGGAAAELLIQKLDAPQRDVRFYAAICAIELRPRSAVPALAERLFDQDYGVRSCALEALSGYPPADLEPAFTRARAALAEKDLEPVSAATAAIVTLGDVGAIEDLIGTVERGGRVGENARRALVALTAQDFGTSERKWRKWWDGAHDQHRIEWLIEGLGHREAAIREAAIHDLRRLTGEYFGYHHDLPRREREAAAERWASWWHDTGRRRFTPTDSERSRPTAKLPGRDE